MDRVHPASDDPTLRSIDSALRGLTLREVLPDDAVVARLQRALAESVGVGLRAGEVFVGRYRLEQMIGRGAMGTVWRALDLELQRPVAIKLLSGTVDPASSMRLRREARAVAQLAHPNVASIYDVVVDADPPFIAMEYVEGGDLKRWLDRDPPPPIPQVLEAFEAAGLGLGAAHKAGLVHRDFKPANVIVGNDRVRVVDFGLARTEPQTLTTSEDLGLYQVFDATVTRTGATLGTPAYMAPEQHVGGAVTSAADVFAYACSLYEALYGERPYRTGGVQALYAAKRAGPPASPPVGVRGAVVPAQLYPIVARGLAPHPADRWPSMEAFVHALRRARRTRPWRWLAGACVPIAGLLWLGWSTPQDRCVQAAESFASQWARQSSAALVTAEAAGIGPELRRATSQTLADFGARWVARSNEACAARPDDTRSEALLDCLGGLRRGASEQLARAVDTTAGARRFARGLDVFVAIEECGPEALDGLQPMPADPELRREIDRLAAWTRGAHDGTLDPSGALARAEATAHLPTVARVHLALADRHGDRGDAAAALASCEEAFSIATEGGSDWLALTAASICLGACSNLGRVEEARRWDARVAALSVRLDVDRAQDRRGRGLLASALARAGELDQARALAAEIDDDTREGPPWSRTVLEALAEIGMVAVWLSDYPLAIERLERGHAWTEQYFDADDELVTAFEARLASAYRYVGRYDDAEALFVRMLERPLPHVMRMMARLNFAQTLADQPARLADAYAELQIVRDELLAEGGQGSLNEAHVLAALGQVHHKANRPVDARRALTQARTIYDRLLEPGHIHAQNVDQWLARVDADEGPVP